MSVPIIHQQKHVKNASSQREAAGGASKNSPAKPKRSVGAVP